MVGNLGRVSTFGLNDSNIGNIIQTQRNINDLSAQISSGKKARRYEGIADRSNRLVNIENELERTLQYRENNATVERRLDGMEASLAAIIEMGIELKADLVLASNPGNAENTPLAELGRAFYEQAAAFLNLEQDNRYLFGGTRTDRPPVASLEEVTKEFRNAQANGAGLDVANLAGKDTTVVDNDENAGVPLRTLQIIDFFLNDSNSGTLNSAYPVTSTQAYAGSDAEAALRANSTATSFKSLYYRGDQTQLSSKVEDNIDLEYGVKADRTGLEKALLAGWLLAEAQTPTPLDGPPRLVSGGLNAATGAPIGGVPTGGFDLSQLSANFAPGGTLALTINGNAPTGGSVVDVSGDGAISLNEVAAAINNDAAFPNVSATVQTVAVQPTAYSTPVAAGGAVVPAIGATTTINGVTFATTAGGTAAQFAAEVNATTGQTGAQAAVRSNGTAEWVEITNVDGSTPAITAPATGFTVTETKEVIELTNLDGSTPTVTGADAAALGFATDATGVTPNVVGTANSVLDLEDRVEVALKLLEDALQDMGEDSLSKIRSDVGVDLQRLEDSKERYNQFEIFHEEVQVEIENTDIATAATQLSQNQLILESSFLAISSISQLSLANFLR